MDGQKDNGKCLLHLLLSSSHPLFLLSSSSFPPSSFFLPPSLLFLFLSPSYFPPLFLLLSSSPSSLLPFFLLSSSLLPPLFSIIPLFLLFSSPSLACSWQCNQCSRGQGKARYSRPLPRLQTNKTAAGLTRRQQSDTHDCLHQPD